MWKLTHILAPVCLGLLATAMPTDPNDADYECLSSLHSYDDAKSSFTSASKTTSVVSTGIYDTTITLSNVPHTTLCDGRVRAVESYRYTTTTYVKTHVTPWTVTINPTYTAPRPTCEIAETACTPIKEAYWSSFDEWLNSVPRSPYPKETYCKTSSTSAAAIRRAASTTSKDPACSRKPGNCMIMATGAKTLYYWPRTTVSGDFCLMNGSTITPEPTITGVPNTAVVKGITFTSPTNYLSIEHAHAVVYNGYKYIDRCGSGGTFPDHDNIVVPITASISSRVAPGNDPSAHVPLNFAHLNQPIPAPVWDKFNCMFGGSQCPLTPTIYNEGSYRPTLAVPAEILDLEDEWREVGCTYIDQSTSWRVTPVPLQTPPPRPF